MNKSKEIYIIFFIIVICTLLSLAGCNSLDNSNLIKSPITIDGTYNAKGKNDFCWNFKAVDVFDTDRAIIDSTATPPEDFKGIVSGVISTIDPELQESLKNMRSDGRCPAPFLNQNAVIYFVLTDKSKVLEKMNSIKEGDKVHIAGYYLNYDLTTSNGTAVNMSMDNKIKFVYVNQLSKL